MRIGIFLPNWVGDVVMATPALRALRAHFGDRARLVGILRPYVSQVLASSPWLDETLVYDRKSVSGLRQLIVRLRRERLDCVLLLTNSLSTGLFAWLAGTPRRIGYARDGRSWLLTDPLTTPRDHRGWIPRSAVDHYLDLTRVLAPGEFSKLPELATTTRDEHLADRVWSDLGWRRDDPVMVLNTGGAYGAAKAWPEEHFGRLARRMVEQWRVRVLVLCGPAEREAAQRIRRVGDHPWIRSLAEYPPGVGLTKACVRRAHAMVTTDSGPRHFAAAFRVPVVTIFGPTDPRWSHNYHPCSIDLQLDVPCGPCGRRVCPWKHHRCMRELTVEMVAAPLGRLLARVERENAA